MRSADLMEIDTLSYSYIMNTTRQWFTGHCRLSLSKQLTAAFDHLTLEMTTLLLKLHAWFVSHEKCKDQCIFLWIQYRTTTDRLHPLFTSEQTFVTMLLRLWARAISRGCTWLGKEARYRLHSRPKNWGSYQDYVAASLSFAERISMQLEDW